MMLTPEKSMELQNSIGADIMMVRLAGCFGHTLLVVADVPSSNAAHAVALCRHWTMSWIPRQSMMPGFKKPVIAPYGG